MECFEQKKKPMIIIPSELYGDSYYRFSKRSGLERIQENKSDIAKKYYLTDSLEDFLE